MALQAISQPTDEFILKDDEVLEQFAVNFDRLFANPRGCSSATARAAAEYFLKHHVLGHFAYEERHVFPGLLRADLGESVVEGVAAIRQDHRALIKEIKQVIASLAKAVRSSAEAEALRIAMVALQDHLQRHATLENKLFPSLV